MEERESIRPRRGEGGGSSPQIVQLLFSILAFPFPFPFPSLLRSSGGWCSTNRNWAKKKRLFVLGETGKVSGRLIQFTPFYCSSYVWLVDDDYGCLVATLFFSRKNLFFGLGVGVGNDRLSFITDCSHDGKGACVCMGKMMNLTYYSTVESTKSSIRVWCLLFFWFMVLGAA